MDMQFTDSLAAKLQHFIDAKIGNTPIEVIEKAFDALDKNIEATKDPAEDHGLIERFRKYRGMIKDTTLSELLEDRREGLL